ncbi:MAG: hypothetical protein RIS70_1004 [Planctomycetota bacterium]
MRVPVEMLKFLDTSVGQAVLWTTALLFVTVIGYYLVLRFRDRNADDELSDQLLLSKFREIREQGAISESEFRTIKTKLGDGPTSGPRPPDAGRAERSGKRPDLEGRKQSGSGSEERSEPDPGPNRESDDEPGLAE